TLGHSLTSHAGNISLIAAQGIEFKADADIRTASTAQSNGTIDLEAKTGNITMAASSLFTSTGEHGHIRLLAQNNITVGQIKTEQATVSLTATAGSILDADGLIGENQDTNDQNQDIQAKALRLNAGTAIGESINHLELNVGTLSAAAKNGGIYLLEANAVEINEVSIEVNRVLTTGLVTDSTVSDAAQSDLIAMGASGHIVLTTTQGTITLYDGNDNGLAVQASGNLLIQAGGSASDLLAHAELQSVTGHISLSAGQDIQQHARIVVQADSATIDLLAERDIIMAKGSKILTEQGDIRLEAHLGSVITDFIQAGRGTIAIFAADVIADQGSQSLLSSADLILHAGEAIGSSANTLNTSVARMSIVSGQKGAFITEQNGLLVDSLALSVQRIDITAQLPKTLNYQQSGIQLNQDGAFVLSVLEGDLEMHAVQASHPALSVSGASNVRLEVLSGSLRIQGDLDLDAGHLSLIAHQDIVQAAGVQVTTKLGDINIQAGGNARAELGAQVVSDEGHIRYQIDGDLLLATHSALKGHISLIANHIEGQVAQTNLVANTLRVNVNGATNGFGTSTHAIQTQVEKIAAQVGSGGLFITQSHDIAIIELADIVTQYIDKEGELTVDGSKDVGQSGLLSKGHLVLYNQSGSIVVDAKGTTGVGIQATDNVLLKTAGIDNDIVLNSNLITETGSMTIDASQNLVQNADIVLQAQGQTLDAQAGESIFMLDGHQTLTYNGHIRYLANQTVHVSSLNAGQAQVSLIADRILDAGDAHIDIVAQSLSLQAVTGVGHSGLIDNALEIDVELLSGLTGKNGLYIQAAGTLTIERTSSADIQRIGLNASTHTVTDASQVGILAQDEGVIVIAADDVIIKNDLSAKPSGMLEEGTGSIFIKARTGDITLDSNTQITTSGGNIVLDAHHTINLGIVNAGSGHVALVAHTGMIVDQFGSDEHASVLADGLMIDVKQGVGTYLNALQTQVNKLTVKSTDGAMFIQDATALSIDTVELSAHTFSDDSVSAMFVQSQSGIVTEGGAILLHAAESLTLNDVDAIGYAIKSDSGHIRLTTAQGSGQSIVLNGAVKAGTGHISLQANAAIYQNAQGDLISLSGTIDLVTLTGAIIMDNQALAQTDAGHIRYHAATDVQLSLLDARAATDRNQVSQAEQAQWGSVRVIADAGSITHASQTEQVNVYAHNLRLEAQQSIGHDDQRIHTRVVNLAALAQTGHFYVTQTGDLSIDHLADFSVNRVEATGLTDLTLQGEGLNGVMTSQGALVLTTQSGHLTVNAAIQSLGGPITLTAAQGIALKADINSENSVSLAALAADIHMHNDHKIESKDNNVRLYAKQDIVLASVKAQNVSLIADLGGVTSGLIKGENVTAGQLRVQAANHIGQADRHLTTDVASLSAHTTASTSSGIYITDVNAISVGDVSVTVAEGTSQSITDRMQSGLVTTKGGHIVLVSTDGQITVGGSGAGISAQEDGHIRLDAKGVGSDIVVNSAINANNGHLSLTAANNMSINANLTTGKGGTISLIGHAGDVVMQAGTSHSAQNSSLRVQAHNNILASQLNAAHISLVAQQGSVLSAAGGASLNASHLRIYAADAIGTSSQVLSTRASTLSAISDGHRATGIYITQAADVMLDTLSIGVTQFNADASMTSLSDAAQMGLIAHNAGSVQFSVLSGSLNVNAGSSPHIVADSATLNIAGGIASTTAVLKTALNTLNVTTQTGSLHLSQAQTLHLAGADITGNARVNLSQGNLTLGSLNAHTADIHLTNGRILAQMTDATHLEAQNLNVQALGVGSAAQHLQTRVQNLSAELGQHGLYIAQGGDIVIKDLVTTSHASVNASGDVRVSEKFTTHSAALSATKRLMFETDLQIANSLSINATGAETLNNSVIKAQQLLINLSAHEQASILNTDVASLGVSLTNHTLTLNNRTGLDWAREGQLNASELNLAVKGALTQSATQQLSASQLNVNATTITMHQDVLVRGDGVNRIHYQATGGDLGVSQIQAPQSHVSLHAQNSIVSVLSTPANNVTADVTYFSAQPFSYSADVSMRDGFSALESRLIKVQSNHISLTSLSDKTAAMVLNAAGSERFITTGTSKDVSVYFLSQNIHAAALDASPLKLTLAQFDTLRNPVVVFVQTAQPQASTNTTQVSEQSDLRSSQSSSASQANALPSLMEQRLASPSLSREIRQTLEPMSEVRGSQADEERATVFERQLEESILSPSFAQPRATVSVMPTGLTSALSSPLATPVAAQQSLSVLASSNVVSSPRIGWISMPVQATTGPTFDPFDDWQEELAL
uniref:beta strand repeat-containing protein n=1 Tax=Thiomicrospira microaerophila TaxID=406020 RepID=UPI0005CB59A5